MTQSSLKDRQSRRVTAGDRDYLERCFERLCRVHSPSGSERACAELVSRELDAIGIHSFQDDSAALTGSDCGNLLARIPGVGGPPAQRPSLLLCAHLDTVPLNAPVEPLLADGYWENTNEAILGADNKAAIAVILALARHISATGAAVDLELLFTVCEERSLAGAQAFDTDELLSDFGFVFDHASPIGEMIVASPSHFRLEASFHGAAAHAGIRPQDGRSAILAAAHAIATMPHGRVDDHSTVNVATIAGGSAINVVPEYCRLEAEVRSLEDRHAEQLTEELIERIHEAANIPDCQCDVDISVERTFTAYRTAKTEPAAVLAQAALRRCGYEPLTITSGGASDANALISKGFQTVNLANGTEHNHEPSERVSSAALHDMLEVALALLDCAADIPDAL